MGYTIVLALMALHSDQDTCSKVVHLTGHIIASIVVGAGSIPIFIRSFTLIKVSGN
jgi:hypothetical protein